VFEWNSYQKDEGGMATELGFVMLWLDQVELCRQREGYCIYSYVECGPCQHGMACSQVAVGGYSSICGG
jgi:hypothetical protein